MMDEPTPQRETERFSYRANGTWWEDPPRPDSDFTERVVVAAFEAVDGSPLILKWSRPELGFKGRGSK